MYAALAFRLFVAGLVLNFQFLWLKYATNDVLNSLMVLCLVPFYFNNFCLCYISHSLPSLDGKQKLKTAK